MAWYYSSCGDCAYWNKSSTTSEENDDYGFCVKTQRYKQSWSRVCSFCVEYFVWYDSEKSIGLKEVSRFLLVKICCGFQYFDKKRKQWMSDALYDNYRTNFLNDWRNNSPRVVKVSEKEMQEYIVAYLSAQE